MKEEVKEMKPDEKLDRLIHVYKGPHGQTCIVDQTVRPMPDGSWVLIFMTGGPTEPHLENYIALCRSADRGATWSTPETVLRYPDRACLLSEATVHDGLITIYGHVHDGYFENWTVFTITSADQGQTWTDPVPFQPAPRRTFVRNLYVATWGTWYLPLQSYDVVPDPTLSPLRDGSFARGMNLVIRSDDQGKTWEHSNSIGPLNGWNENNLVELRDGSLTMLVRAPTDAPCLRRSSSTDRGRTWSDWEMTDIPNPGTKIRLFRLTDGRILLLHNPNATPGLRNPLSLWISDDDMRTWSYKRIVTDFPGQLSYPDGFVDADEKWIHYAFDYNRHDLIAVSSYIPD